MKERIIFNYQLVMRIRSNPLWLTLYLSVILIGFFMNIFFNPEVVWTDMLLLIVIYYLIYLFWGIWYLRVIKRKIKFYFPFIPWFGVFPKNMISYQEFKQFEFSYLLLSSLSFAWIFIFIPTPLYFFSFSFIASLFMFRIVFLIRLLWFNKANVWIKYEHFGISAYRTD